MSKMLEKFAVQSLVEVDGELIFSKEKFAELIVRECARVYWNIDDGETHTEYVEALKQHFGVEE